MTQRFNGWPVQTSNEQGKLAEERFFGAWNKKSYPKNIVSIERATEVEDLYQKTDAVIVQASGPTLKIQIKSYRPLEEKYFELMEYGVVVVWVLPHDSYEKIRKKTLIAIEKFKIFQREIQRKPLKEKKENKGGWVYLQGRKNHYKKPKKK